MTTYNDGMWLWMQALIKKMFKNYSRQSNGTYLIITVNLIIRITGVVHNIFVTVTLCAAQTHVCARYGLGLTQAALGHAVFLAVTSDHLQNGLGCWGKTCGRWCQLAIITLVIPILKWVQQILMGKRSLTPDLCLHMCPHEMLLQGTHCRWQLFTFCHVFTE